MQDGGMNACTRKHNEYKAAIPILKQIAPDEVCRAQTAPHNIPAL